MPLRYTKVEAKPVGLYLALLAVGVSTQPAAVEITVGTGGAAAGATTIPVEALTAAIPKNTVLEFTRAAGSPASIIVVTTADAAAAAVELSVEMYEGAEGDGLTHALAAGDAASWDQLLTATGTENAPFTNNPQTQELSAITYGGGSGVSVQDPSVQSVAPQIARTGLFIADGDLVKSIIRYTDTNRNWWAKHVSPDAEGKPYLVRQGLARLGNLSQEGPADGLQRLSYNVRFRQIPDITFPQDA